MSKLYTARLQMVFCLAVIGLLVHEQSSSSIGINTTYICVLGINYMVCLHLINCKYVLVSLQDFSYNMHSLYHLVRQC